tara:strand:- start:154 stop:579 length:426 start_codon:yes stop_codon:yes gene_type:complete
MTNSDTTYGVHNVDYRIFFEFTGSGTLNEANLFNNVAEAKAYFFHDDALAMFEENCTWLGWRLPQEGVDAGTNNGLIMARGFGTKGPGTAAGDDWADHFSADKQALVDAGRFFARANIMSSPYATGDGRGKTFDGSSWNVI